MIEQANRIHILEGIVFIAIGNIVLWDITIYYHNILWLLIIVAGVTKVFVGTSRHINGDQ